MPVIQPLLHLHRVKCLQKEEEEAKAAEGKEPGDAKMSDALVVDDSPASAAEPSGSSSTVVEPASAPAATSAVDEEQCEQKGAVEEENNEDVVLSHRLTGLERLSLMPCSLGCLVILT